MERYKLIKEVGDGTFGTVWQAINKQSCEVVAIKKMKKKYYSWEECVNLREVKSLRRLTHRNIVKLKEVIRENDILYFVFEYMDCNVYQLMKERGKPFSEVEVRNWCFQIFQALAYMHQRGYFHRDLKPENLLAAKDIIKVADFGLAREISSNPPFTEYVSTRWYRAPEVLLQSYVYGSAVDMWAMGAIIAELLTLRPLFPGSSEVDELHKICNVIGTPNRHSWAEGLLLADAIKFQFPQVDAAPLSLIIPSASQEAINLISSLCAWDPSERPTASETLKHPFFQPCFYIPPSFRLKTSIGMGTPPSAGTKDALEQKTARRYSMGVLSTVKPATNFSVAKVNAAFKTGAQRKLEMDSQGAEKNEKIGKNDPRASRYQPPMKQKAETLGRDTQRACDAAAEKLAQLTLNSSRAPDVAQRLVQPKASPIPIRQMRKQSPSMKAGGWRNHTDFMGRPLAFPARSYSPRKVAG